MASGWGVYLVVSLPQRLDAELVPAGVIVELVAGVHGDLDVAARQGQVEARLVVVHKVKRHLGPAQVTGVARSGRSQQPKPGVQGGSACRERQVYPYLREALLLEVGDDRLAAETRVAHHAHHLHVEWTVSIESGYAA